MIAVAVGIRERPFGGARFFICFCRMILLPYAYGI